MNEQKEREALAIIKQEAIYHSSVGEALNYLYKRLTGREAVQKPVEGHLRRLPDAAAAMGLGHVYRTQPKKQ